MSGTEYRFDGLDEMEQHLTQMIQRDFPEEFERMVIQVAYELQKEVKLATPHVTGRLQDSWKIGDLSKVGDTYYIEVSTNVEYAEPVEYGHRTRGGKGFVKGRHMMAVSLEEVSKRLPNYLQNWLTDFLETHEL